jgi:hypothetical protein
MFYLPGSEPEVTPGDFLGDKSTPLSTAVVKAENEMGSHTSTPLGTAVVRAENEDRRSLDKAEVMTSEKG